MSSYDSSYDSSYESSSRSTSWESDSQQRVIKRQRKQILRQEKKMRKLEKQKQNAKDCAQWNKQVLIRSHAKELQEMEDDKHREIKDLEEEHKAEIRYKDEDLHDAREENERLRQEQNDILEQQNKLEKELRSKHQEHEREKQKLDLEALSKRREERRMARDACEPKIQALAEVIKNQDRELEKLKVALQGTCSALMVEEQKLSDWKKTSQDKLKRIAERLGLAKAKADYERGEQKIKQAIAKTGQQVGDVGLFLNLTHQLLSATLLSPSPSRFLSLSLHSSLTIREITTESKKLEALISTFNELISRECPDKLTIKQYFGESEHLRPLIPLLAARGMKYMDTLKCADEKEGDAITKIIEDGLQKAKAEAGVDDDNKLSAEETLEKWKVPEFWEIFKVFASYFRTRSLNRYCAHEQEVGWDEMEDWVHITDEDLIEMGITKKPKRIKFLRNLKKGGVDDGSLMNAAQKRLIREICFEFCVYCVTVARLSQLNMAPLFCVSCGPDLIRSGRLKRKRVSRHPSRAWK